VAFHGGGSYSAAARFESRFDEVADKNGFIVVYPSGTNQLRFPKDRFLTWNDGRPYSDGKPNAIDDVGFTAAMLDDIARFVPVDRQRVYAAGYSNGAQFVYRLAKQLPDRIAAIAVVAGQRGPDEFFQPPSRPISVMQFSGLEDKIGPFRGGTPNRKVEFVTVLKPVPEVIKAWAEFDGCPPQPAVRTIGAAEEQVYGPGRDGTQVVLWTLKNGGHTWPGGNVLPNVAEELGNVNRDIFAAAIMWEFFKAHPLNEKYVKGRAQ
jgi:polyhydroxybutyrate depolymerase